MQIDCFLKQRLQEPLPGKEAQNLMRPRTAIEISKGLDYKTETNSYKNSSVLLTILTWPNEPEILFTLRTEGIKHGGQVSFPGGGSEGDETIIETALREAYEETGLIQNNVEIVGALTPLHINHTNYMVTPVVGIVNEWQEFTANPNEVAEIFTVPISKLINGKYAKTEDWKLRELDYKIPLWDVHHVPIWGATAMMLSEFTEIYMEFIKGSYK